MKSSLTLASRSNAQRPEAIKAAPRSTRRVCAAGAREVRCRRTGPWFDDLGRPHNRTGENESRAKKPAPIRFANAAQFYKFPAAFGRKNCSDASVGTIKGDADFESGLNLEKTDGLSRKCRSSVCILVPLAG